MTRLLTADDVALWRRRPAVRHLATAAAATLVATVALVVLLLPDDDGPSTAEVVADPGYWGTVVAAGVALGALVTLLLAPRTGLWVAAAAAAASAAGTSGAPLLVGLCGTGALVALATVDAAARARQRVAAGLWGGPRVVPGGEPPARAYAVRRRGGWTTLGAVTLVGAVACAAWFVRDVRAAEEFRASATVAEGTVVALVDDDWTAVVDVDGLDLAVPLPSTTPEVGSAVVVRYDRHGRAELVDDAFDPSLVLLPAAGGAVVGLVLLGRETARRRRVRGLLVHDAPAVRVRATWDGRDVLLSAADDGRPFAAAQDLLLLSEPPDTAEHEDPFDRPVGSVSDDELLDLAHGHAEDDWPPESPPTWDGTPVLVVGLVADGSPVALRGPDDRWYVTETVVDLPRGRGRHVGGPTLASAGAGGQGTTRDGTAGPAAGAQGPGAQGAAGAHDRLLRLAVRTGRVGPWLAAVLGLPLGALLAPEVSALGLLGGAVLVAWGLHAWSWAAEPALAPRPRALVVRGALLDAHVPWRRVEAVVASADALVVRVAATSLEQADAILLPAAATGGLVRGAADPFAARDALLTTHDRAVHGTGSGDTRRRPGPSAVVAALGVVAFVGGVLLGGQVP
ncbi:hypothetical protein [Cellulosimicrobium marinum]|uniref:hypothetical protein n=1 Tax=Cellulosimicrobium marinum TaxID=1638992 RepID=UPI001E44AFB5|nr:hypothetical protein [Cellulosimicrobium marinum]MCB7136824.1 hypothetical protein [Cellulosimicrobium marinum]